MERGSDELLDQIRRISRRITCDELVARGLGILEGAGFDRDEMDGVAQKVGMTVEDLAHYIASARFGSGKVEQASDAIGEAVMEELGEIRRLLVAQQANELSQEWYMVSDAAALVGLRPYTLRQACNLGRIREDWCKKGVRSGKWRIHRDAITWVRNHGLPSVDR